MDPIGYSSLKNRKFTGEHYTPDVLSGFVANQIITAWKKEPPKTENTKILDPACGDGNLLLALITELFRYKKQNLDIKGFDTDINAANFARIRIKFLYPETSPDITSRQTNRMIKR